MQSLTTSELHANLKSVLDHINDDCEPVTIRRAGCKGIVLLDADDYASMVEALHLVLNPANAERLQRGMTQHRASEMVEYER